MQVEQITAAETHPLRRSVLREGTASDEVVFDGDDDPATFHLGIRDAPGGRLIAIASWMPRQHPDFPGRVTVQLRGMATDPGHRGRGDAGRILAAGVERCTAAGAELVWARARLTAVDFYVRHGFTRHGEPYVDATTGLPHIDIIAATEPSSPPT